jgi:hypothetical protein
MDAGAMLATQLVGVLAPALRYLVGKAGRRGRLPRRVLKMSPREDPRVVLHVEGRTSRPAVRLLVAEASLGWQRAQAVVPRDGNRAKVRTDNLQVVCDTDVPGVIKGPSLCGSALHPAKLTGRPGSTDPEP